MSSGRYASDFEALAISKSAPHLTDAQVEQMEELQQRMEATTEPELLHVWLDLDKDFHFLTFAGASQPSLMAMIEAVWTRLVGTGGHTPATVTVSLLRHLEHRLLVDASARRDPTDAERVLQMHIRRTRLGLSAYYRSTNEAPRVPG